jgi:hypothetical protein
VLHKTGAQKCINYVKENGIRHGIDYLIKLMPELNVQEVRPFLVHTPFYEFISQPIDTDIQTDRSNLFQEYDQFDYVPQLDHIGNDIDYYRGTLQEMLMKALQTPECVAVNTLGFFKNKADTLIPSSYFKPTDGIYIKKNR